MVLITKKNGLASMYTSCKFAFMSCMLSQISGEKNLQRHRDEKKEAEPAKKSASNPFFHIFQDRK
jgi:hypothetical protein